jgi:hypothetical protein
MSEPTKEQTEELQAIIDRYEIKLPKKWDEWTYLKKLDYVGERILMGTRTSKKHSYLKEQGWLSSSQLERRQRREVYGRNGDITELPIRPSDNPSRVYVSPDTPPTHPVGYAKEVRDVPGTESPK